MCRHVPTANSRDGQSLIESCVVICLIGLVFAGLLQISMLFASREILHHAAARGARAKTVGFNWWMVEKSIRVASIPNAGRLIEPAYENRDTDLESMVTSLRAGNLWEQALGANPASDQLDLELARIPQYLDTENETRGSYLLDYEEWDTVHADHGGSAAADPDEETIDPLIHVQVRQDYPLRIPLHQLFYAEDEVQLEADSYIENHYSLYIDDQYW